MEFAEVLPYAGWIIAGAFTLGAAGIWSSVHTTKLKIKNGYPLEGMWGQSLKPVGDGGTQQRVTLLTQENAELRAELAAVKDRLANVERIVTDSGYHLGSEIDRLRSDANERSLAHRSDEGNA